ncbi:carbon-nitrogen hydrolase [Xylariaceae sp. AK1471]|nr:carbon-nitrogen hydrolase [Xylariaceae sp. AK1471]
MPSTAAPSTKKIRLATASPATQSTRQETLSQLERLARTASDEKADFLLLPEAYFGGYPRGSDFGCKIGGRTEEGRDEFARYFRDAVDLGDVVGDAGAGAGGLGRWVRRELADDLTGGDGDEHVGVGGSKGRRGDGTREELERVARETGVFIVVGVVERAGGSLYCAVVYVCPRRGIIGKRRKVMPTGMERLIWAQGSPATLKAVSTTIRGIRVNLAAAICWENYMPLLRQSLYAQNINLYLAPTADGRDTWLPLMRTIGIEGRCFVVSSNMCVRDAGPGTDKHQHQQTTSAASTSGAEHRLNPKPRRNSCITEDGFEIALPSPSQKAPANPPGHGNGAARTRRRSVFDEDGNEIVLNPPEPSSSAVIEEDEDEIPSSTSNHSATTAVQSDTRSGNTSTNIEKTTTTKTATFLSRGGSSVVSPFGEVLAGPQWEDEHGIIYADVDMDDCVRGRLDLDAAGSYSRSDSFKFSVEGLDLDPLPYYT